MRIRLVLFMGLVVVATGGGIACGGGKSVQPEGQIVFTRSVGKNGTPSLYVMASDGSSVHLLARNASEAAVAPSGRRIAFVRNSGIWVVNRDGSDPQRLTRPKTQQTKEQPASNFDRGPAWSPDGRIVYFSRSTAFAESLFSVHGDGTPLRQLTQQSYGWDEDPAPSPDGLLIVFASTGEKSGLHDLANTLSAVTAVGRHARLPFRLPTKRDSPDGTAHAAPTLRNPAWSPNGRTLAYDASDTSWGTGFASGLYVSSFSGSLPRRLVADGGAPAWSPDSRWIAFTKGHHIWLVRPDGTGRRQLSRTAAYDRDPTWLPPAH